ncbi:retrovirus-related pol polyprotein from transposon TNT 1-94 [Tanacetum coccineum]|uniref:Retrovirus-related pol polyprotein from transposon TNT 1-94 n=1 Tax=Tanacetum coccineum TaxID=301880 RepID=A0ABQ5EI37_9ASTR
MKLQTDSLQQKLNDQIYENYKLRAQLKGKFSESQMNHNGTSVNTKLSKPSTSITKLYSVTSFPKSKLIPKVVEKNDLSKSVNSYLTTNKIIEKCTEVLAPGLLKIEFEPINAYFKNNRVVHREYWKVTKEHVATLHELLEEARALKPLDEHIGHASKFAERIQELLVYVSALCPFIQSGNENKAKHSKDCNTMLLSIGRVSSINASGSKSRSITKNNRIPQPSSRSMKNKVEAHHRKFKSSDNKNNHVSDCNANVKNVALSKNSDTICLSYNECLFSVNHDACVVQYLKKMKITPPSSSNDTSAIVVPPGHILTTIVILVDEPCPKLSLRYANAWGSLSKCMLNTKRHPFNLHDFGFEGIIRDEELPPWKFDYLGIIEIVLCYMGYGDLQMGNILISRVYYVEGLGHNLFSVRQFCDSDLEVAFRKHTCFVRNLEGVDLLSGSHDSNLYTISMADMMKSSPICLLSKASKTKSWLWHHHLSHLNFGTINQHAKQGLIKGLPNLKYTKDHLCSACQMGKSKKESHQHKPEPSTNEKLQMLHMDLYRPMRVKFLTTKDEAPEIIIKILKQAQASLNATVRYLRIENDTEFLNQNYMEEVGITHHISTTCTP